MNQSQSDGFYNLSKNFLQNTTQYTVTSEHGTQGTISVNGIGLISKTKIYMLTYETKAAIKCTVATAGKIYKGTEKAEIFRGTANWEIFYGGEGNDTISGKMGHDVAVYDDSYWGKDTISKTSGSMTILFAGITEEEIVQKMTNSKMVITKKGDSKQKITINGWNNETHNIVFQNTLESFSRYVNTATPTENETAAARNEVFAKAGIASA